MGFHPAAKKMWSFLGWEKYFFFVWIFVDVVLGLLLKFTKQMYVE